MNNPFILLGSYIGLAIGIVGIYFSFGIIYYFAERGIFEPWGVIYMFIPPTLGFLIGWGIHAWIQYMRK